MRADPLFQYSFRTSRFLTQPSSPRIGLVCHLVLLLHLLCMWKKKSETTSSASPSIVPPPPKNHYFSVLRSAESKSCRREQRRGKKCQCLKKESSLIESESTFASSWMSEGVIGDWLQIMNNYIKVGALLVRVCVCGCITRHGLQSAYVPATDFVYVPVY